MIDYVISLIENYGWYVLLSGILLVLIYNKYLKDKFNSYLKQQDERQYAAKYHKNPDLLNARLQAQEAYVQRLQTEYNKSAEQYLQKQEEKAAQKAEELEQKYLNGGKRLDNSDGKHGNNNNKSLKSDYNPLMGSSSYTYRPPRRSPCGGGGCGR